MICLFALTILILYFDWWSLHFLPSYSVKWIIKSQIILSLHLWEHILCWPWNRWYSFHLIDLKGSSFMSLSCSGIFEGIWSHRTCFIITVIDVLLLVIVFYDVNRQETNTGKVFDLSKALWVVWNESSDFHDRFAHFNKGRINRVLQVRSICLRS